MPHPVVNPFEIPYELWTTRQATAEDIRNGCHPLAPVRENLLRVVASPLEAARHVAEGGPDNGLTRHINEQLDASAAYKEWRAAMPSRTPACLSQYQQRYPDYDPPAVQDTVTGHGILLPAGQVLFHGGSWDASFGAEFVTDRPLSTSLSPNVAFMNAVHRGKAYDAGKIDLWVVAVVNPDIRGFVFRRKGTSMGHELEVLLQAGIRLRLTGSQTIRADCALHKVEEQSPWMPLQRTGPVNVLEVSII